MGRKSRDVRNQIKKMEDTQYPWGDKRPYNSYSNYFKKTFGQRVQKLSIDAGFTCPNRDGTISRGGCSFCDNNAFNPSYCDKVKSISQQIEEGIEFHQNRYKKAGYYLAYFQPYSNTYAPLEKLKELYSQALKDERVIGLVIGTRPDCVSDEILDYIAELSSKHYIILEYGIESCYDKTLERINRGHGFSQTLWAINESVKRGIKTGGHLIFGLPGEEREEMIKEAEILSPLGITSLKFHQLQIFKNTKMEEDYLRNPQDYKLFEFEEYKEFIIDFMERLNPNIVIERFAGEVPPRFRANEGWGNIRNEEVVSIIEKRMKERNTYQGRLYE